MNLDLKKLGNLIFFHRKKSGLSRIELARLAGVGKTVVYEIERGKQTVQLNTLMKIFGVLNISIQLTSPFMKEYEEMFHEES